MPWIKESLPRRAWASFIDFFASWWKEANVPLDKSGLSPGRSLLRRAMLWIPRVLPAPSQKQLFLHPTRSKSA